MKTLLLSKDFHDILNEIEHSSDHYLITGRAGTGKSTLLQLFKQTTHKKVVLLAPTGVAALNIRGQTIHSFFGFPPRILNASEIKRKSNYGIFLNIDTIVIDEVSMVRSDILDNIDVSLRVQRGNPMPFGGVQMIFFGDLFQLPPVVASQFEKQYFSTVYESAYFFSAKIWQEKQPIVLELRHIYRQEERIFIDLLDKIRTGTMEFDDFQLINERFIPIQNSEEFFITLCSRNDIARHINEEKLNELRSVAHQFQAKIEGEFSPQLFPTDFVLSLKVGAQVMFVKNDPLKRFVNGSLGTVSKIFDDKVYVTLHHGSETEIIVESAEWEYIKYDYSDKNPKEINVKVLGVFSQLPLKLAWAITIHKSQGKTFDSVLINMGKGAFESGQAYVALSRCRTLDGVFLQSPLQQKDIIVDNRIVEYYENLKYIN